jgi:methionyl-tRNA synthetase
MKKKILVCTAWPYGSGIPHLGNITGSLLPGDVFTRYYKLKGHEAVHVSGTDAHGTKIEFEAFAQKTTPKELSDRIHAKIVELLDRFEIRFENYTTTESPTHKRFVTDIYKQIDSNKYIVSIEEDRAFCEVDQKFLADSFIVGTCPRCGFAHAQGNQCDQCGLLLEPEQLVKPICQICKQSQIVFKKTKNWFLDLTKLEPKLKAYHASHPEWADNVKNFTDGLLKEGLKPRSVTRDIQWGIPAPFAGAQGKVIYVWAEAALGYVSATIEYFEKLGHPERWKEFWFGENVKQVYVQGKDNIPFHTVIFPGQLISSEQGYHLPDQVAASEYLNWIGKQKFSKSRKIGIFWDDALELLEDPTYWRFYLLYLRPEKRDIEFSWEDFDKAVNGILIDNIGNLVNRVVSLAGRKYEGIYPKAQVNPDILKQIERVKSDYERSIEAGYLTPALRAATDLAVTGNEYIQNNKPWDGNKPEVILTGLQLIKAIIILLEPFVPAFSRKAYGMLNLDKPTLADILEIEPGKALGAAQVLLPKVDVKALKEKYSLMKTA